MNKLTTSKEMEPSDSEGQGSSQLRSYKCNFCKQGFSNAQALGGHMNIHRRDRAKLNQTFKEDDYLLSSNVSLDQSQSSKNDQILVFQQSESSCSPHGKRACNSSTSDEGTHDKGTDGNKETRLLTLFVDMPSPSDHKMEDSSTSAARDEEIRAKVSQDCSQQELDLELRLGLQPR